MKWKNWLPALLVIGSVGCGEIGTESEDTTRFEVLSKESADAFAAKQRGGNSARTVSRADVAIPAFGVDDLPGRVFAVEGGRVDIALTMRNRHPSTWSNPVTMTATILRDGDRIPLQVSALTFMPLGPGMVREDLSPLTLLPRVATGEYALFVEVVAPGVGRRMLNTALTVFPAAPDLTITELNVPREITRGADIPVTVVVENRGSRRSTGTLRVILSMPGTEGSPIALVGSPLLETTGARSRWETSATLRFMPTRDGQTVTIRARVVSPLDPNHANNARTALVTGRIPEAPAPAPGVAIPVTIVLDTIECFDEEDLTSVFYGDDPRLITVATTTDAWEPRFGPTRSWSDVESNDANRLRRVDVTLFREARHVRPGHSIGMWLSLWEGDTASSDDEIDFVSRTFDYAYLAANWGRTITLTEDFNGPNGSWYYGGGYRLRYRVIIGSPETLAAPAHVFVEVNPNLWVGRFRANVDGEVSTVDLTLNTARRNARVPQGRLTGTWQRADGRTANISTTRLIGNFWQFCLADTVGGPCTERFNGYLIGDAARPLVAGTRVGSGLPVGFTMEPWTPDPPAVVDTGRSFDAVATKTPAKGR